MEQFLDEFLSWAWARHHNPLSWYIRPLFLLPFCYFAYKRSTWGIVLTLFALATSMVWFPSRNGRTTGHSSFWRDGEGLSYGPLDPYEGALGSAGAGKPSGVGPGFLEEIPSLRVGSSRLDCADQDRVELLLRRRVGAGLVTVRPRGPYSLQSGGSVRGIQGTRKVIALTLPAGSPGIISSIRP
jgi:hypothetical protein